MRAELASSVLLLFLVASGCRSAPAVHGEPAAEVESPSSSPPPQARVEYSVETRPLRQALAAIAEEAYPRPILIAHEQLPDTPIPLTYSRYHWNGPPPEGLESPPGWGLDWREALERAANEVAADIWPLGDEILFLVPRRRVTMEFDEADVGILLDVMFRQTWCSTIQSDTSLGTAAVDFRETPLRAALDEICSPQNVVILREGHSIYRISTPEHERRLGLRPLPTRTLGALGLGRSFAGNDARIDLDEKDTPVSEIVERISAAAGVSIGLDPKLEGTITVKAHQILWRDALELIPWFRGGVVWDDGRGNISLRAVGRCSMSAQTALHFILGWIADAGGVRLEISDDIDGDSGIDARDAPWRDLLYSMSRKVPFHLVVEPDGTFRAEPF